MRRRATPRSLSCRPRSLASSRCSLPISERVAASRQAAGRRSSTGRAVSSGWHPGAQRTGFVGMCMVVGPDKLLKAEPQRIAAADKERGLEYLRKSALASACRRKLALRQIEGIDFLPRGVHSELMVCPQVELKCIAARWRSWTPDR